MFQDGLDDLPVFGEADDPHGSPTLRTGQGIDLVDLLRGGGRSWDYAFLRIRSIISGFLLTISSPIKRDFTV